MLNLDNQYKLSLLDGYIDHVHTLPTGYVELEYVDCKAAQNFATGITISTGSNIGYEITTSLHSIAGTPVGGSSAYFGCNPRSSSIMIYWNGTGIGGAAKALVVDTKYVISQNYLGDLQFKVDGTNYYTLPAWSSSVINQPIVVGAFNTAGAQAWDGKIYEVKISSGTEIVRDLIPARDTDGNIGMYDIINGQFYTSTSGTSFIAEAALTESNDRGDIPSEDYIQLDYIQSDSGTNVIETNIAGINGITVETKISTKDVSTSQAFVSARTPNKFLAACLYQSKWLNCITNDVSAGSPTADTNYVVKFVTDSTGWKSYIDGTLLSSGSDVITSNGNIALFSRYMSSAYSWTAYGKMYYTKITDTESGEVLGNFVPAQRKSDGVLGMYDLVSKTFLTNKGTGTFSAGYKYKNNLIERASLPEGYIQLDYLKGDGTSYINTNYIATKNDSIEVRYNAYGASGFAILGTYSGGNYYLLQSGNTTYANARFGSVQYDSISVEKVDTWHTFKMTSNGSTGTEYFDGALVCTTTLGSYTGSTFLFSRNTGSSANYTWSGKIAYFKVWQGDKLIHDYIPCKRLSDNELGMFDTVDGIFYTNANTSGSFTAGNVVQQRRIELTNASVPEGYTQLDYLESTGTQYIDTGVIPQGDGYKYNIKFNRISGDLPGIFGVQSNDVIMALYSDSGYYNGITGVRPSGRTISLGLAANTIYDIIGYGNNGTVSYTVNNGTPITGATNTNFDDTLTTNKLSIYLFKNNNTAATQIISGRVYYFKIWQSDKLLRNMIPARRDSDSVLGMYDTVEDKFYTNAGSGTFTAGTDTKSNLAWRATDELADVYGNTTNERENEEKSVLPDTYTELEYIQSSGTQYIDTLWTYSSSKLPITIKHKHEWTSFTAGNGTVCGLQNSSHRNWIYPTYHTTNSANIVSYMGNQGKSFYTATLNTKYDIEALLTSDTVTMRCSSNGTIITENSYSYTPTIDTSSPLFVFAGSYGGNVDDKDCIKLYSLSIETTNGVELNLIPAKRNSDSVIGMYDTVNNKFYTNSGTGTFVAGPEVYPELPDEYEKLLYVQSSGTQYIDTGVKTDSSTDLFEFHCQYQHTSTPTGTVVISGCIDTTTLNALGSNTSYYSYCQAGSTYATLSVGRDTSKHTVYTNINKTLSTQSITVDGTTATKTGVSYPTTVNLYLLAYNSNGTANYFCSSKLYSASYSINGSQVRNFIPAKRKSDSVVGMYDTVNDVFYENAGTGTFIGGSLDQELPDNPTTIKEVGQSELPAEYQEVEYIIGDGSSALSVGGACLDNATADDKIEWESVYSFTDVSSRQLFGYDAGSTNHYLGVNGTHPEMGTASVLTTLTLSTNTKYRFVAHYLNSSVASTDNSRYEVYDSSGTLLGTKQNTAYLGTQKSQFGILGTPNYGAYCKSGTKFYGGKVWINDELVGNIMPCIRKSDNKVGVYNFIDDTFWYQRTDLKNSSTTDFKGSAGPEASTLNKIQVTVDNTDEFIEGYYKLDYIATTRTQAFDTGITPTINTGYDIDLAINSGNVSGAWIFGGPSWKGLHITTSSDNNLQIDTCNSSTDRVYYNTTVGERLNIKFKDKTYVNGDYVGEFSNSLIAGSYNIYCGCYHSGGGTISMYTKFTLYRFKIYESDSLIRNFIPAMRKKDNAVGMLDLVEGKFYENKGTGVFSYGNSYNEPIRKYNPEYIPSTYERVEYIESSGTQYIDTGIAGDSAGNHYKIKIVKTASNGTNCNGIIGTHNSADPYNRSYVGTYYTNVWEYGYGASSRGGTCSLNTEYDIDLKTTNNTYLLTINGTVEKSASDSTARSTANVYIGTVYQLSSSYAFAGRIYYAQIYNSKEILQANLIPVRRVSDNEVGMYDTINQKFYTNAGTGSFTAGDLYAFPAAYTRLDYIQSSGTQYIDTGYPVNDNVTFEGQIYRTAGNGSADALYGYRYTGTATAEGNMRWFFLRTDNAVSVRLGKSADNSSLTMASGKTHIVKWDGSSLYIDGTLFVTASGRYTTTTYGNGYLFAANATGYYSLDFYKFSGRIYYWNIWDNGSLVRKFIPAMRNSDGVVGMYDMVTKKFFTNAGTGTFTYGSKVDRPKLYIGHFKQPLRKVGEYRDKLNGNTITRKLGSYTFNGSETWTYESNYSRFYVALPDDCTHQGAIRTIEGICDHYKVLTDGRAIGDVQTGECYYYPYTTVSPTNMYFYAHDVHTTVALYTAWLALNPVKVIYPLAEETEEEVEWEDNMIPAVKDGGSYLFEIGELEPDLITWR